MDKKIISQIVSIGIAALIVFGGTSLALAKHATNNGVVHAENSERQNTNGSAGLELQIKQNGSISLGEARVTAVSNSTIIAISQWGPTTLTWTIVTDGQTKFVRKHGGNSMLSEVSVGDTITVKGTLVMSGTPFTVRAEKVQNWSVERANGKTFSGTVQSVNASATTFILATADRGNVNVQATSTTRITSGNVTTTFASILVGGHVQVKGVLNTSTNVLTASEIKITSPEMRARTFQGRLQAIASTTLPTYLTVNIGGVDYRVNVALDTSILNTLWLRSSLANFRVGDSIRAYGIATGTTIDATVIRDISIRL